MREFSWKLGVAGTAEKAFVAELKKDAEEVDIISE